MRPPPNTALAVSATLALLLLALACDGDSSGPRVTLIPATGDRTATPARTTPAATATATGTATPAAATATAAATVRPRTNATPAIAPADLTPYQGQTLNQSDCAFDPRSNIADCGDHGFFALEPPMTGQDVSCILLLFQGEPVAVGCTSQEPPASTYYGIGP